MIGTGVGMSLQQLRGLLCLKFVLNYIELYFTRCGHSSYRKCYKTNM